ncbi:hypothetical protein QAD02_016353 [Eretmocerus hayati]|uniref:Uncharacterized protein n=1 Tax=Eretmocerus hayati TaxID=131215 RepID=A0ACC2PC40_9HYME|nr:hypothetical protein QAD02_016353 [Eretmocerus hayati]
MGRCQSTPGLVESRGRVPLEEMMLSPMDSRGTRSLGGQSVFSPSPSPLGSRGPRCQQTKTTIQQSITPAHGIHHHHHHQHHHQRRHSQQQQTIQQTRGADSPVSATSSAHSSEDPIARTAHTQPSTGRHSTHSGTTCNSLTHLVSEGTTPILGHEPLLAEIKRLRDRLVCLESENASMSLKLNQKQWEVEHRLAEIEMQICGASDTSSVEDNERNRESII